MALTTTDLSESADTLLDRLARDNEPMLVRRGDAIVAALIPLDEDELDDFLLANLPEFIESRRQADEDLKAGRSRSLEDVLAELDAELESDELD
jgi:hypothetical protein